MVFIITGTIKPSTNMRFLKIVDYKERFEQYFKCIEWYVKNTSINKIVFCENSNYGASEFNGLVDLATNMGKRLEIISFQGDIKTSSQKGKGYGEGEIIEYILKNSNIIKNESYLIKVTGRLIVENIESIYTKIKKDTIYFNVPNNHMRNIVTTRLYAMPIHVYNKCFLKCYLEVNDSEQYYLENAFTDAILKNHIKTKNFIKYPRVVGLSGTTGKPYLYSSGKCILKDIISIFNYYGLGAKI